MSAIILYRTDRARNVSRFYHLDVQADLFGEWCFMREWGRIGRSGQTRVVAYPASATAYAALERHRRAKERRGYSTEIQAHSEMAGPKHTVGPLQRKRGRRVIAVSGEQLSLALPL